MNLTCDGYKCVCFSFRSLIVESILDPSCWTIINEDRNTCSLVARQHELFKLTQGYSVCTMQSVTFDNKFKSIIIMSVSYNNRFLALYTDSGVVWMGTTSLEKKCEFNTNRTEKPTQIEWLDQNLYALNYYDIIQLNVRFSLGF